MRSEIRNENKELLHNAYMNIFGNKNNMYTKRKIYIQERFTDIAWNGLEACKHCLKERQIDSFRQMQREREGVRERERERERESQTKNFIFVFNYVYLKVMGSYSDVVILRHPTPGWNQFIKKHFVPE